MGTGNVTKTVVMQLGRMRPFYKKKKRRISWEKEGKSLMKPAEAFYIMDDTKAVIV